MGPPGPSTATSVSNFTFTYPLHIVRDEDNLNMAQPIASDRSAITPQASEDEKYNISTPARKIT
jgi:hypothetical protein